MTDPDPAARPVLVTGATGTVGRHVVAGLLAAGVPVRAAVREPGAAAVAPQAEAVRFAFDDRSTWPAALDRAGALFLMRPPQIANVAADLLPFVDAALAAGARRVVFLSLQGAERVRVVPHRRVERHLEASGAEWTFLRPSYFFQNLLTALRDDVRDRGEIAVPAGRGRTSFVDAREVAEVAVQALTRPGHARRAHELTGPDAPTYAEVAAALTAVLDHPVRYTSPSPPAFVRDQRRKGVPLGLVAVTLVLYTTARLGLAARTTPELATLLGRPALGLEAFVAEHADAWRRPPPA